MKFFENKYLRIGVLIIILLLSALNLFLLFFLAVIGQSIAIELITVFYTLLTVCNIANILVKNQKFSYLTFGLNIGFSVVIIALLSIFPSIRELFNQGLYLMVLHIILGLLELLLGNKGIGKSA